MHRVSKRGLTAEEFEYLWARPVSLILQRRDLRQAVGAVDKVGTGEAAVRCSAFLGSGPHEHHA